MQGLYLLSVWLHILAVVTWLGGIVFLVLVLVPWLRRGDRVALAKLLRETGRRFSRVSWVCFAILLVTGSFNLWVRGVRPADFARADFRASPFGIAVLCKLAMFGLVLAISAHHDFVVGPRATAAMEHDPRSAQTERLRRWASIAGRVNAVLALLLVGVGVIIVRGWPW